MAQPKKLYGVFRSFKEEIAVKALAYDIGHNYQTSKPNSTKQVHFSFINLTDQQYQFALENANFYGITNMTNQAPQEVLEWRVVEKLQLMPG